MTAEAIDFPSVADVSADSSSLPKVGYVMTHYPRTAQTFISGEVDAVERAGLVISCFAMNEPDAAEMGAPGAMGRRVRTLYLKAAPMRAIGAALRLATRHPFGMTAIAIEALRSAGASPKRMARRMAHYIQAALVASEVRRRDLCHLHAHFGLAPATIAWLASRMASLSGADVRFSFTIHGFHDFVDPDEARLDLKAASAAAIMCISDYTKSQLCRLTPPSLWGKFRVVRCGVDLDALVYAPRQQMTGPPTILAVGRLSAEKGFAVLIEAVASLHRDNVQTRLRIVGDGPDREMLARAVRNAGLDSVVTFTGELGPDGVRDELRAADIFCLPSFNEGLPVSIMEAMAVGVPVVATWIAGIPELAENGITALTVAPGRADMLAAALRRLCEDQALGDRLAIAARSRVEQLHDQEKSGAEMADLFKGICG